VERLEKELPGVVADRGLVAEGDRAAAELLAEGAVNREDEPVLGVAR
jgi:hypothetical protein